jgi:hypothetical protein
MPPADGAPTPVADRIAFVGGLHRSGTTPLTRWLATHPGISGLQNTGVQEDEGQHLQSVYSIAQRHGGPGRFAFDDAARLTERSELVTSDAAGLLVQSWSPYWDLSRRVLLEKSPPNLLRMRFLRALFPKARFIVVVRHPAAVAMATQKWSHTSTRSLIDHWVRAHEQLVADATSVGDVAVVRYEDLMLAPDETLSGLFHFLGVEAHDGSWPVARELNERYFAQYESDTRSVLGRARSALIRRHEGAVAAFGYSLLDLRALTRPSAELRALAPVRPESWQ